MFEKLRQRNQHRVALAYLAGAWLLIQVVETLTPDVLPAGTVRIAVVVAAIAIIAVGYSAIDKFVLDPVRDEEKIEAATCDWLTDDITEPLRKRRRSRSFAQPVQPTATR